MIRLKGKLMTKDLSKADITRIAMESGFMLSTRHGQVEPRLMPVSDVDTLVKFAYALSNSNIMEVGDE